MIKRDENGLPVAADKLSDITSALKDIEKKMDFALKKSDAMTEDEKSDVITAMKDLEPLMSLVNDSAKSGANPMELIGLLKQVMKIKSTADKIKGLKND